MCFTSNFPEILLIYLFVWNDSECLENKDFILFPVICPVSRKMTGTYVQNKCVLNEWSISAILLLHLIAAPREVGVRNKPSLMIFVNSLNSDCHASQWKHCFLCRCNQGKTSRLLPNHYCIPEACLLRNFWVATACSVPPFLPLQTHNTLQYSYYLSGHSFFIFFVGFSFSSSHLKFCFS